MADSARSRQGPLGGALREFLATEVAGGVVLVVAAAAALVWANSPWSASYDTLWTTDLDVALGRWELHLDLRHWVNDGLMAIFFVVVALEVKRELLEGELREVRKAALPVVAAVGGMVVPAALYLAFNPSGDAARGWGIPMATDIAFALGVAALVARSLPAGLRLFLLTLAIVDDIGAIVVIAVFYSSGVAFEWLAAAVALVGGAYLLRRAGVIFPPFFVAFGAAVWLALHEAGVHPTLAGVAMGLLAPASARFDPQDVAARREELLDVWTPAAARRTSALARQSVSPMEWLEHGLHPWTSLGVVPLFALANAGVSLSASDVGDAVGSAVTWGVLVGLMLGKTVGITGFAWLAVRLGIAALPVGATWRHLIGTATLAGIGFTVSLFVTGLAFERPDLVDHAKIGILTASALATALATVILVRAPSAAEDSADA
jgi:Na+:H+ antiporter, NhaA family